MAISNVPSQVAELLQSIGGGLENDKALQLLIAMILLLALLQGAQNESQGQSQSAADLLRLLGGGQQGQSHSITLLSSSTTITFQQTSISMVSVSSFEFGSSTAAGGEPSVGQELDASA